MTIVLLRIFLHREKRVKNIDSHSRLLSFDAHEMSMNIAMKIIRPCKILWCFTQSQK